MTRLFTIFNIIFIILFTQSGCDFIDGNNKYKEVNAKAEEANKKIAEMKVKIEQLEIKAENEANRNTEIKDGIEWFFWLVGVSTLAAILFSPLRNLIQRVLFKTIAYKPRRFDKDRE